MDDRNRVEDCSEDETEQLSEAIGGGSELLGCDSVNEADKMMNELQSLVDELRGCRDSIISCQKTGLSISKESCSNLDRLINRVSCDLSTFRTLVRESSGVVPSGRRLAWDRKIMSYERLLDSAKNKVSEFSRDDAISVSGRISEAGSAVSVRSNSAIKQAQAEAKLKFSHLAAELKRQELDIQLRKEKMEAEVLLEEARLENIALDAIDKRYNLCPNESIKFRPVAEYRLDENSGVKYKFDVATGETDLSNRMIHANGDHDKSRLQKDVAPGSFRNYKTPDPFAGESGRKFRKQLDQIQTPSIHRGEQFSGRDTSKGIIEGLAGLTKRMLLPVSAPPKFSGERIDEYLPFRTSFENLIHCYCSTDQERFQYLLQFTEGAARELVASCFRSNPSESYAMALKTLDDEYGSIHDLARHHMDILKAWPLIKNDDGHALRRLSLRLMSIRNMMHNGREFSQFDHPTEIRMVIDKLPQSAIYKWRDHALRLRRSHGECNFSDLVNFVKDLSDAVNQPVFGEIKVTNYRNTYTSAPSRRIYASQLSENREQNYQERLQETESSGLKCDRDNNVDSCIYCRRDGHVVSECVKFSDAKYDDKLKFLMYRRLCFRCMSEGHTKSRCYMKVYCKRCNSKDHVTGVHNDQQRENDHPVSVNALSVGTKSVISPSVSVFVKSVSGQVLETGVALDSWASANFISRDLCRSLGCRGTIRSVAISTLLSSNSRPIEIISELEIINRRGSSFLLRDLHVIEDWPFSLSDTPNLNHLSKYEHLSPVLDQLAVKPIGILVGNNEPRLVSPIRTISGFADEPYITLYTLGWALSGPVDRNQSLNQRCHRASALGTIEREFERMYKQDFVDEHALERGLSCEDKRWLKKVEESLVRTNEGNFQIDLLFRNDDPFMPNNYGQALGALNSLARKFRKDHRYAMDYIEFMNKLTTKGYLELVPDDELRTESGKCWYLVHHGVYHKVKKKIRVVFDCSRSSAGVSLNDKLLPVPDLMNKLLGVILRFREQPVAVMGDIEAMFMQIKVPIKHSNYMRVLWWPHGDLSSKPLQFRLRSHTFGAVSSPSIANYALKRAASDAVDDVDPETIYTLQRCSYVDDVMRSFSSVTRAVQIMSEVKKVAHDAGFNLIGLVSNSRHVLSSFGTESLSLGYKDINLNFDELPSDRVLGVFWHVSDDSFSFRVRTSKGSITRRSMLSIMGGVYDPLALAAPVLVPARCLFQQACHAKLSWDDELPLDTRNKWLEWVNDLSQLEKFNVPRCFTAGLSSVIRTELHVFCDGSLTAYAAVAFVRLLDCSGNVRCTLVMSKTRQTPLGGTALRTIPRIELNSAKLAVIVGQMVKTELTYAFDREYYWTDSQTVLKYLRSDSLRLLRFVENRVSYIRSHTDVSSWHYVAGSSNVADIASRGVSVSVFLKRNDWVYGPIFLQSSPLKFFEEPECEVENLEIKVMVSGSLEKDAMSALLESTSDWRKLRFRVAVYRQFFVRLSSGICSGLPLSPEEYAAAERVIWRFVQNLHYSSQISIIRNGNMVLRGDPLYKLSPFLDEYGLLRVKGRLGQCSEEYGARHPIILPGSHHVVQVMICNIHVIKGHFGRNYLISILQENYYIFGVCTVVKRIINECFLCRRMSGRPRNPEMASLPADRVEPTQKAFYVTGIDFFGPIMVTRGRGRKCVKNYGVVFSCLTSRAIHLEVAESLDVSSFLNAFRRFVARRGEVNTVYSDNGTNLVGGCRELRESLAQWNRASLSDQTSSEGINWNFNPPTASNFGGIWEREIRSVRKILFAMCAEHSDRLTSEVLQTFMCEAEFILNSRPLTPVMAQACELGPISPNHILMVKTVGGASPPGVFSHDDLYSRKRWRYTQYLSDVFWLRWRKEYLSRFLKRQKWVQPKPNAEIGDLVLLTEPNTPRAQWPMGLIHETIASPDGVVRRVVLRVAKPSVDGKTGSSGVRLLTRPVNKLIPVCKVA